MTEPIATKTTTRLTSLSPPFDKLEMDHDRFIVALEKYGSESSGEEWYKMAQYLNWQIEEVKLYAYWYMHRLHNSSSTSTSDNEKVVDNEAGREKSMIDAKDNNHVSENGENDDVEEWTSQECILFDTLLATYRLCDDETEKVEQDSIDTLASSRWKKISAMIPNKSSTQCRNRYYNKVYGA